MSCLLDLIKDDKKLADALEMARAELRSDNRISWCSGATCARHLPILRMVIVAEAIKQCGDMDFESQLTVVKDATLNECFRDTLVVRCYGTTAAARDFVSKLKKIVVPDLFAGKDVLDILQVRVHFCAWEKVAKTPNNLAHIFVMCRQLLEKQAQEKTTKAIRQQKFDNLQNAVILYYLNMLVDDAPSTIGPGSPDMACYLKAACKHFKFTPQQYRKVEIIAKKRKKMQGYAMFEMQAEKGDALIKLTKNMENIKCIANLEPAELEHFKNVALQWLKLQTFQDLYCFEDSINAVGLFLLGRSPTFDNSVKTLRLLRECMQYIRADNTSAFTEALDAIAKSNQLQDIPSDGVSICIRFGNLLHKLCEK